MVTTKILLHGTDYLVVFCNRPAHIGKNLYKLIPLTDGPVRYVSVTPRKDRKRGYKRKFNGGWRFIDGGVYTNAIKTKIINF